MTKEQKRYNQITMQKRGFILPLVIIIVATFIVGAGAFYLGKKSPGSTATNPVVTSQNSPAPSLTPDETASWKTYSSDLFTLKYPPKYYISESLNAVSFDTSGQGNQFASIKVDTRIPNISADEAGKLTNSTKKQLSNGYEISGSYGAFYSSYVIYNSNNPQIVLSISSLDKTVLEEIAPSVIDNFRVNNPPSPNTNNQQFKHYSNEDLDFSVDYPRNSFVLEGPESVVFVNSTYDFGGIDGIIRNGGFVKISAKDDSQRVQQLGREFEIVKKNNKVFTIERDYANKDKQEIIDIYNKIKPAFSSPAI